MQLLFTAVFSLCIANKTAYLHAILRVITVPYKHIYAGFKFVCERTVPGEHISDTELRTLLEWLSWMEHTSFCSMRTLNDGYEEKHRNCITRQ